jgi:hypothetical protein
MKRSPASTPNKKSSAARFDPFEDRISRDIRNSLSKAFSEALAQMEQSGYRDVTDNWCAKNPSEIYLKYIQNRVPRYDRVFKQIKASHLDDALLQCLVIWNNELFFEVHDHLEGIWIQATGDKRQALKGLIKASGVYIHNEYGRQQAVKNLSIKSHNLIRQYSHSLTFITNLDVLAQKLIARDPIPPRLENPALGKG